MHTAKVNYGQNGFWNRHNRQQPYISPPRYLHQQYCFHQYCIKVCLGDGLFFFPNFHIAISSLPFEGLGCQDFKTDPHPDVFSFSLPLKASGLNELEHKWANNRHILSTDTPHVFVHICKFIPTGFSIALTSTWPVLEPFNFY